MYELCHQLLVEENNYVAIHEDTMLPEERKVLQHLKVSFHSMQYDYHPNK